MGLLCVSAARASAAPPSGLFRVTIAGTAQATWDHTAAPSDTGDNCKSSLRSEGMRTVRFRSTRPTLVRFVGGRILQVAVRGLAGTVTLSGPNTLNRICSGVETHVSQPCANTTRTFTNGHASLGGSDPGTISIDSAQVSLRRADCPLEPVDVVRAPLGPVPGAVKVSLASLSRPRVARVTLRAMASRHKMYAAPEAGKLTHQSVWTLTFTRVQP